VVLADRGIGGGPGRVEVPKGGVPEAVRAGVVPKDALEVEFRLAVRVDGPLRMVLGNRSLARLAVGGSGRREDAAVEEKTMRPTPAFRMADASRRLPITLLR